MKRRLVLGVSILQAVLLHAMAQTPAQTAHGFTNTLLPRPAKLTLGAGSLAMPKGFSVSTTRFSDARLQGAILRMLGTLEGSVAVPVSKHIGSGPGATLVIEVQGAGEAVQSVDEDEAYALRVTPAGAKIEAATVVGAMRAMQTFVQLLQSGPDGYLLPAVEIEDAPRFRWRGLMMDCGRHFEPVEVIERTLDGMAAVKLNVFHWHLSEDQGFRIESLRYPKLTGMGSDGLFFTQQQAREIVAYARARGIRVVPEFDMPGHSRSWFVGYPELASGPGPYTIRREFGIDDAAMDPTRESTYAFLDGFLGEMAEIFPDPYMHIGGDESDGVQWKANAAIQTYMRAHGLKDEGALQAYFNQRLLKILNKHHKRMVGWDEVLNPALPKDVVIQSWRGAESLTRAAQEGYQGILSQPYYLDAMKSAEEHYLADPLPSSSGLGAEQRKLVLGGEICMWAEQVNERSIESRIWPRSAAIAERFWSPESVRDVGDMYRRLAVESNRLEALGLTHVSHEGVALRALAGSEDIEALRVLASVLQPVSFSDRYHNQRTDQLTPLTSLVDTVRPDPRSRFEMTGWTAAFLASPKADTTSRAALESEFRRLLTAAPAIEAQVASTPVLARVQPLAQRLAGLAQAGIESVEYVAKGKKAPVGWKQRQTALIAEASQPQTLVRFTFLAPLKDLVSAVQE